jgi:hypothetical protein
MGPTPSSSGPVLSLGDECLSTVLQQFPDQPLDGFQTMHLLPDAHANPVPPLRDFFLPGAINVIHTLCFPLLNSSDRHSLLSQLLSPGLVDLRLPHEGEGRPGNSSVARSPVE